jgi:hypothetical protein
MSDALDLKRLSAASQGQRIDGSQPFVVLTTKTLNGKGDCVGYTQRVESLQHLMPGANDTFVADSINGLTSFIKVYHTPRARAFLGKDEVTVIFDWHQQIEGELIPAGAHKLRAIYRFPEAQRKQVITALSANLVPIFEGTLL